MNLRQFLFFALLPYFLLLFSGYLVVNGFVDRFAPSAAPRAAEEVPATDSPADLPAGGLLRPSVLPITGGSGPDGVASAGETATSSATPTPPSAAEELELRERLDASQPRLAGSGTDDHTTPVAAPYAPSDEPWVISGAQWWALGLYASNSREWADDYSEVVFCESRNRVDAVGGPNADGSYDHGGPQINDVHADRFDLDLVKRDPVYATESAWELWGDDEDWGPWEACRPEGGQDDVDGLSRADPCRSCRASVPMVLAANRAGQAVLLRGRNVGAARRRNHDGAAHRLCGRPRSRIP